MKKIVMTLLVLGALATAVYRVLPVDQQRQLAAQLQLDHLKNLFATATASEPKKYRLVVSDDKDQAPQDLVERNEHATKTQFPLVATAYIQHSENVEVQGEGRVIKLLPDDTDGNKHQRFLVRTTEDVTVLIAHNISLAPRIENLTMGDTVSFVGEYVWNEKGGVVHWTHRDPHGRHPSGFITHDGVVYR